MRHAPATRAPAAESSWPSASPLPPCAPGDARLQRFYASDAELYRLFKSINGLIFAVGGLE